MGDDQATESFLPPDPGAAASALDDAATSTVAMAMLFGAVLCGTASVAARLWLAGLWEWRHRADLGEGPPKDAHALDVASLPSLYRLLSRSTALGLILLYSYVCERHPPFFHAEKTYDRDEFFFWTFLVVVCAGGHSVRKNGARTRRHARAAGGGESGESAPPDRPPSQRTVAAPPAPENAILNRDQTEEWKGWMQFTFLLYHYMHATELYNGIRVLITCYVWLTGFGHCSFFYATRDYSLPRVLGTLWRLNFLAGFLCLVHGNPYVLYYICPLHTYFFGLTYAVMYVGHARNHARWWLRAKLGALAVLVFLLWDVDAGVFAPLHAPFLSDAPGAGAARGSRWEWYFRSYLDHWSALLGMVFALNFPVLSLFYRKLEARSKRRQWMGKAAVAAGMVLAFTLWATGPLLYAKVPYNSTNPYLGFVPLVTYVYLRNLTPRLRSHSLELLQEIGKTTLETYLMQHHIWLTSDSKTILVFLPGWPRVNLALVTYLYVRLSRHLHALTLTLRRTLLPDDRGACLRSLAGLAAAVAGCYCTAFLLEGAGRASLNHVGMVAIVGGYLLYLTVMDASWPAFGRAVQRRKAAESGDDLGDDYDTLPEYSARQEGESDTLYSRLCPPLIGAMVLYLVGFAWSGLAATGASAVGPLPPHCDAFVNEGLWVPIDGCNEASRGMAYRDFGVASYGTCAPHGNSYVWAWREQPSRTHCRFGHRNEAKLQQTLGQREVVFIGDSMTRYLYHASMRAMGIVESGAYDATGPKHSDIRNTLWESRTPINFKWAPLAVDQLDALKDINRRASARPDVRTPDLIVLGGGAWDRLHVYATDEDRQSHAVTLTDLGREMRQAQDAHGAAVVWCIPTTINSQALNTEEKRDHMREEDMEALRAVYARNGILSSSSFVIDGPAFTRSRVAESYDGVHYPIQVYDAGAQILFNALDWLLPPGTIGPVTPPRVGKMANPVLGIMMLVLVMIGLICSDGFLGFSYLASLAVRGVMPHNLHDEAFSALHKQMGLPLSGVALQPEIADDQPVSTRRRNATGSGRDAPEIAALIGSNGEATFSSKP